MSTSTSCRLHDERVTAPGAQPTRWALVVHGVFGSGANWRLFMRRLVVRVPSWGMVLLDLRGHGKSGPADPPHDLAAAAGDLEAFVAREAIAVEAVIGHSLGGKVALAYAQRTRLRQLWVLDTRPGSGTDEGDMASEVLRLLRKLPPRFASRDAFVALLREAGLSQQIAAWLAMSLMRDGERYRLCFDLVAIEGLLASYHATDAWDGLTRATPEGMTHYVLGGRSPVIRPPDRQRLHALAAASPSLRVHELAHAGHWLHVDAPDALSDRLTEGLGGGA